MLRELVGATEELARARDLSLSAHGPDDLTVEGDMIKVRRIAQNLLLNALRYTRKGGVQVIWGSDPESTGAHWYVEVRDTGPGLPNTCVRSVSAAIHTASEQSKRVAEAEATGDVAYVLETQVPANDAHQVAPASPPGEGIGLSIVKRLCTLLDATVEIESVPGQGTRFRVLFPSRYVA
jgi:signal transduction histidine kinase